MITTSMLLMLLAFPALASLCVLSLLWVPISKTRAMAGLIPTLAIALGFVVGYWVVVGRPRLIPPSDAKSQLPLIAGGALVVSLLSARLLEKSLLRWPLLVTFSVATTYLLTRAAIAFQWTTAESIVRVFALAVGMTFAIGAATSTSKRLHPRAAAISLVSVAGLGAPLMLFSDSLLIFQLHAALGVAAGVVCVFVWVAPTRISLGPASFVLMALMSSMWIVSLLFANLPALGLTLIMLALPAGITLEKLFEKSSSTRRHLIALGGVIVLVFASLAVGGLRYARSSQQDSPGNEDNAYGYEYDR